jgi:transcription antitermination factor NusG
MSRARRRLLRWYCIQTFYKQESHVAESIRDLDFEVNLPQFTAQTKKGPALRPLFPSYLFVKFNVDHDYWRRLVTQPGVKRLFSASAECPTPVPGRLLEIVQYEINKLNPPIASTTPLIEPGEEVRITSGPWRQFIGICQQSTESRVQLLLSLFGRSYAIDMAINHVQPLKVHKPLTE